MLIPQIGSDQRLIADTFATALPPTFLLGLPLLLIGLVLAAFIEARPLATAVGRARD